MSVSKEQYQAALDVLHENLPMQLQRQDKKTGEWKNIGSCVRGQKEAYVKLHAFKDRFPESDLRVIPKNEADKYREGLTLGRTLGPEIEGERKQKNRKPLMFMPDNL